MALDLSCLADSFEQLPDPVHVMVFERLTINDRLRVASVSKRWQGNVNLANLRQIELTIGTRTQEDSVPKLLDFGCGTALIFKTETLEMFAAKLKSTFPKLKKMSFSVGHVNVLDLDEFFTSMSPVKLVFDFQDRCLDREQLLPFLNPRLIGIRFVVDCQLPLGNLLEAIVNHAPQLEVLHLGVMSAKSRYDRNDVVSAENLDLIAAKLPNLKYLGLQCSPGTMRMIYKLPKLTQFFWTVPMDGHLAFKKLAKSFSAFGPNLRTLSISMPHLRADELRFNLQAELIAACVNLEELILDRVNDDDFDAILNLQHLKSLRLKKLPANLERLGSFERFSTNFRKSFSELTTHFEKRL